MFHVSLTEGEHVVKCVKMNTVPRAQWWTNRSEGNRTTQISHASNPNKTLLVNHDTLEILTGNVGSGAPKTGAGKTIKVKAPARYATPVTVESPLPIEREIIEPTQRVVVLPDDEE